jgi:beta-mannosidase
VDVPGEVHTDLLAAGKIPDPFVADNEYKVLWAAEVNLEYKTSFKLETKILAHEYIFLVAEGLGALARVQINGEMLQSGRDSVIV